MPCILLCYSSWATFTPISKKEVEDVVFRPGLAPWTSSRATRGGGRQKTKRALLLWSTCKGALTSCLSYLLLFCLWYSVHPSRKNPQKESEQMREPRTAHGRARTLVAARLSLCWLAGKCGREVLAFGVTGASERWEYWREACSWKPSWFSFCRRRWLLTGRKMQCQTVIACVRTTGIPILYSWHFLK